MTAQEDDTGSFWTLQEFARVAGKPWFAFQKQTDAGIAWQFTGYRHEVERLVRQLGISAEEREPIPEDEFLRRFEEYLPGEP